MKKTGILNRDVAALVASMGHYDRIVVSDAGFSVPPGVPCVDLSLGLGSPTVDEVLQMLAAELQVEYFHVAEEVHEVIPSRESDVCRSFPGADARTIPHSEFKELAAGARGMVRTGDCRPYANVMLVSGVVY